ncbi:hypothetical protein JHK87_055968 [Glycine soja]|nr:hypothetical protein JHK87_055968 [Glycine soja]
MFFFLGVGEVRLRYIVDDEVLISGIDEEKIKEMDKNSNEGMWEVFGVIEKWPLDLYTENRMAWLRCYGVPLHTWNEQCFEQSVGLVGRYIEMDSTTIDINRVEYAKIWVLVLSQNPVIKSTRVKINGRDKSSKHSDIGMEVRSKQSKWDKGLDDGDHSAEVFGGGQRQQHHRALQCMDHDMPLVQYSKNIIQWSNQESKWGKAREQCLYEG